MATALRIGIVAYTPLQQHGLRTLVTESGHRIETSLLVSQVIAGAPQNGADNVMGVDGWLINVDNVEDGESADDNEVFEAWIDQLAAPVIFCDGAIPQPQHEDYRAWARRLREKLSHLAGTINLAQCGESAARHVWVLAASTGGPTAVKQFLSELPPKLDIGFVYVQHIDAGFDETLAQVMSRHSHYPAKLVEHGDLLRTNSVSIVSPDKATEILVNGTFLVKDEPWLAPYSPSVDSIVADVAHHYGSRAGVIIFTGMGDDGAASARMMKQKGGKVWAQTPGSCTVDSMPAMALATGCVDFKGPPFTLAQRLVKDVQSIRHHDAPAAASGGG